MKLYEIIIEIFDDIPQYKTIEIYAYNENQARERARSWFEKPIKILNIRLKNQN